MLDLFLSSRMHIITLAGSWHFGEAKEWTIEEE